jgi:photosystem II stability/assembly factor-like uncharacterized protein
MSRSGKSVAIAALLLLLSPCLTGAVWYKENLAYGMRDAILLFLSFAPSDPATLYLATTDGYVFSSHNEGMAWEEARIIVKGKSFFGAIRPTVAPSGAPVCAKDVLGGARHADGASFDLQDTFYFDYGEVQDEFDVFETGVYLKAYDPVHLPAFPSPGEVKIRDTLATHTGSAGHAKLGVGLKTGAPRLKGALRSMRVPSVGANLQQVLVEMGVEPTWINHVAVHPNDSNTAIAATSMGTFRTTDGGVGWLPIFAGTNRWERDGQHVRFDPIDPNRVYLGTQAGLFISPNGGDRWERVSGTLLESAFVKWLEPYIHTDGSVWIYAGTTIGAFLTQDGGQTWRWTYYETLPASNYVSSVAIDQQDPTHVILSSQDGLWVTFNGGASWETAGGLMFTATFVPRVLIDPANGSHAFACTERNIWETSDGGRTWQVIYIDNSDWKIRNMELDPHQAGTLWVVTSGQILRLRNYRQTVPRDTRVETFRQAMKQEPSETVALETAMDFFHISPGEQARYRGRVAWSAFVPEIRAVGGYLSAGATAFMDLVPYNKLLQLDGGHALMRDHEQGIAYGGVMLFWDLSGVLFEFDQVNVGRVWGESLGAMYNLKFELARYYNERIRLLYKLIVEPPEDQMAHIDASLRYQELTEHLDALTGGLYADQIDQIKQGGATWLQGLY